MEAKILFTYENDLLSTKILKLFAYHHHKQVNTNKQVYTDLLFLFIVSCTQSLCVMVNVNYVNNDSNIAL